MRAIHRDPGPRGFAVYGDDDSLLAEHLTQEAAWRLLRHDEPPPEFSKGGPATFPSFVDQTGRLDACSDFQYAVEQEKKVRRWYAHWQGVGWS